VQSAPLVVREVVTLVVRHEVYNRPLGQSGRLVENEPPFLDTRSKRAHLVTLRVSLLSGKPLQSNRRFLRIACTLGRTRS
jgi:hypothetical protein